MAADNGFGCTPRSKTKKKSALTKLVERRKRQVGALDADSELGSRVSLQENNNSQTQKESSVPLEPQVIVERKSGGSGCVPCGHSEPKDRPRPRPRKNSQSLHEDTVSKVQTDADVEGQGQGDVKNDPFSSGSKSVPTDSTIYRFRNMRMAAEQCEKSDGKLQGRFVPKPPSTPRTPRSATVKGEKRNHEPTSSDEQEIDSKRQMPGKSEGGDEKDTRQRSEGRDTDATAHAPALPNCEDSDTDADRLLQRGSEGGKKASPHHTESAHGTSPQTPAAAKEKVSPGKSQSSPSKSLLGGGEVCEDANETIDQLHSQYQRLMDANSCKDSPMNARRGSFGPQPAGSALSTPRSGRLAPLQVKSAPPPLEDDVASLALRTAYKADPSYRPRSSSLLAQLNKRPSNGAVSGPTGHMGSQDMLGSDNLSLTSTSIMPVITTTEARSRSFLVGSVSSGAMSILGAEELERYFPDRRAHVFVGSWNMNELKEMSVSMNDFILPNTSEYVQDIYVVGTQENELNKKDWEVRLQETLGPSHVLFHSVSYGCLHLAVFIRRDLIWFCSTPEDDVVSLRAVVMVKTKGAIGISFSMFGTSFLFINCHLTSDRTTDKKKIRLLDYHRVIRELHLPKPASSKATHPATKLPDVTARFDCVFWCGDLNFRLERRRVAVEGTVSQMTDTSNIPHFEELLGGDQLSKYITEGKIFEGFQEGRINFQPTFKFDVNTDNYDSSYKRRIPSYTDRVLFRSRKKNHIACLHYNAVMNIKVSDHRAVYSFFEVTLRPGRDNIPLCAGQFDRDVYVEANKRRAKAQLSKGHKNSSVCAVQ